MVLNVNTNLVRSIFLETMLHNNAYVYAHIFKIFSYIFSFKLPLALF